MDSVQLTGSTSLRGGSVLAPNLANDAITLGYAQMTSNFAMASATPALVTGLTVTVNIPNGGRYIKITAYSGDTNATATTSVRISIWDGTVGSGTRLNWARIPERTSGDQFGLVAIAVVTPSAGSKTYNVSLDSSAATTATINASTNNPAFILVEAI